MFSILDRYENHNATHKEGVYCPKNETPNAMGRFMNLFLNKNKFCLHSGHFVGNSTSESNFDKIWDQFSTVPLFLIIIMFPLINLKSATFFTKFNALGRCML